MLRLALLWIMLLACPAWAEGFAPVAGPCGFQFPRDHGPHHDHRTEWWYFTGNVAGQDGRLFGFQLTFFRTALAAQDAVVDGPASAWRTRQLWLAHAAVTDVRAGDHRHAERLARGAAGLAGAWLEDDAWRMRVLDWSMTVGSAGQRLAADAGDFALELELEPLKPLVAHGLGGYSVKGRRPESASCYASFTRLRAAGTLRVDGTAHAVQGLAWMDHEYSSALLEPEWLGWDWYSLQLDDGSELMLFTLRNAAGELSPASSGTLVLPDGQAVGLQRADFQVEVLERWKSPHTGATYPARWRLRVPGHGLELEAGPEVADQEMHTAGSAGIVYWEGSVAARGRRAGRAVAGRGYVELTGYAAPLDGSF